MGEADGVSDGEADATEGLRLGQDTGAGDPEGLGDAERVGVAEGVGVGVADREDEGDEVGCGDLLGRGRGDVAGGRLGLTAATGWPLGRAPPLVGVTSPVVYARSQSSTAAT